MKKEKQPKKSLSSSKPKSQKSGGRERLEEPSVQVLIPLNVGRGWVELNEDTWKVEGGYITRFKPDTKHNGKDLSELPVYNLDELNQDYVQHKNFILENFKSKSPNCWNPFACNLLHQTTQN